jgi:diguanylate cyclase (GGDEF)-like protein
MFQCDISIISLVDKDRQWFLSTHNLAFAETPREFSFCDHAIAQGALLCIPDAAQDPRFAFNPLVVGEPNIRSYMGQPIKSPDGFLIGTVCVIGKRPRQFGSADRERLIGLAGTVEDLIQAHLQTNRTAWLNKRLLRETTALKKSARLLKQAQKIGKIGAWEISTIEGTLTFSEEMFALSEIERGPIGIARALQFYGEEDRPRVAAAITKTVNDGMPFEYEADFITGKGHVKRIRCSGERFEDEQTGAGRVVGVVQDISEPYRASLALKMAADHDSLTGIYNRHAFDRELQRKIAEHRKSRASLSLILVDLDGFKDINDRFGHIVGDLVLEEISGRLVRENIPDCVLARWGGDEFAVLPPLGFSPKDITALGEHIVRTIGVTVDIAGHKLQVSGTCGTADFHEGMVAKELVRRADLALYHGKKCERGTVHAYQLHLDSQNKSRQNAMDKVREALKLNRVFAAYQPIIELSTNRIVGMEALMRLRNQSGKTLTATQVLPALLDPIISRQIADRMLKFLCSDLASLAAAQSDLQFASINVTEADLLSRDFTTRFLPMLEAARVDPAKVTLEITETMLLVNDNSTVKAVLGSLHDAGVKIALDDFGTGYSSLSHLRDFPISKVKIDRSFVQSMTSDWQARTIVQALISMAKNMNMDVVAEGVEDVEQLGLLRQMGCDMAQGYLFSRAKDIEEVSGMVFDAPMFMLDTALQVA